MSNLFFDKNISIVGILKEFEKSSKKPLSFQEIIDIRINSDKTSKIWNNNIITNTTLNFGDKKVVICQDTPIQNLESKLENQKELIESKSNNPNFFEEEYILQTFFISENEFYNLKQLESSKIIEDKFKFPFNFSSYSMFFRFESMTYPEKEILSLSNEKQKFGLEFKKALFRDEKQYQDYIKVLGKNNEVYLNLLFSGKIIYNKSTKYIQNYLTLNHIRDYNHGQSICGGFSPNNFEKVSFNTKLGKNIEGYCEPYLFPYKIK